jgi:hypothetical protein
MAIQASLFLNEARRAFVKDKGERIKDKIFDLLYPFAFILYPLVKLCHCSFDAVRQDGASGFGTLL